jgi:hypothetical protein
MPFKSKAQRRFMYAAEARGDVPKGTADRWEGETEKKPLPEKVEQEKKASLHPMEDMLARYVFIKTCGFKEEPIEALEKEAGAGGIAALAAIPGAIGPLVTEASKFLLHTVPYWSAAGAGGLGGLWWLMNRKERLDKLKDEKRMKKLEERHKALKERLGSFNLGSFNMDDNK